MDVLESRSSSDVNVSMRCTSSGGKSSGDAVTRRNPSVYNTIFRAPSLNPHSIQGANTTPPTPDLPSPPTSPYNSAHDDRGGRVTQAFEPFHLARGHRLRTARFAALAFITQPCATERQYGR